MVVKQVLYICTLSSLLWAVHYLTSDATGCHELSPPFYGVLIYDGVLIGDSQPAWQENDTVTFLCDRGYVLVGPSGEEWNITCVASNNSSDSSWSNTTGPTTWNNDPEQFICAKIDCGQPPSTSNGSLSLTVPNATDLLSTAQYTCDAGYKLNGTGLSVCWWDGVWRPSVTCIATSITDCGEPPTISNGVRTWTVGNATTVGATVTYTCDSGYERDGAEDIACTTSGQWTDPPRCTAAAALSSLEIYIIEGAGAVAVIIVLLLALFFVCCYICRMRLKQRQYVEGEEALANNSGAFTLSNPLVTVKDEDAAGNPLYLTPDELNEFEQQQ